MHDDAIGTSSARERDVYWSSHLRGKGEKALKISSISDKRNSVSKIIVQYNTGLDFIVLKQKPPLTQYQLPSIKETVETS